MLLIPVLWPFAASLEGRYLPVVTALQPYGETETKDGTLFYVSFTKVRNCEFLGVNWYQGTDRLVLQFEPDADLSPVTRPVGEQVVGPWLLRGVRELRGTRASVRHRCHPLWTTTTELFP